MQKRKRLRLDSDLLDSVEDRLESTLPGELQTTSLIHNSQEFAIPPSLISPINHYNVPPHEKKTKPQFELRGLSESPQSSIELTEVRRFVEPRAVQTQGTKHGVERGLDAGRRWQERSKSQVRQKFAEVRRISNKLKDLDAAKRRHLVSAKTLENSMAKADKGLADLLKQVALVQRGVDIKMRQIKSATTEHERELRRVQEIDMDIAQLIQEQNGAVSSMEEDISNLEITSQDGYLDCDEGIATKQSPSP